MNIILRELRSNRKALIIWSISIFLFIIMGMIKFDGFHKMGDEVQTLLDSFPKSIISMFRMDAINLTQIGGYYSVFFVYFMLLAGIHAITLGATIISKEERDKTADFLLVKPIKRNAVVTEKLIFSFISIAIINAVTLVTSLIFTQLYNNGESIAPFIFKCCLLLFIVQLVFLSVGLFLSSVFRTTKRTLGVSTGVFMITYILSFIIPLNDNLKMLKPLTPFTYFDVRFLLIDKPLESIYFILSFCIILVCICMTYILYNRRDIHS